MKQYPAGFLSDSFARALKASVEDAAPAVQTGESRPDARPSALKTPSA